MATSGVSMARQNHLLLVPELVAGVLDENGNPVYATDITTGGAGYSNPQSWSEHLPDGLNASTARALVGNEGLVSGTFMPQYSRLPDRLDNICGAAVSTTQIDGNTRRRRQWRMPDMGAPSIITQSAFYGTEDSAVQLTQGKIRSFNIDVTRNSDGGSLSGNIEFHFNKAIRSQLMPTGAARVEIQQIVFTDAPESLQFALRSIGDATLTDEFTAADAGLNAALEAAIEALPDYDGQTVTITGDVADTGVPHPDTGETLYSGTLTITYSLEENAPQLMVIAGEVEQLNITDAEGPGTWRGATVTPGDSAADVQAAVRDEGGVNAAVVVAGESDEASSGENRALGATVLSDSGLNGPNPAANAFDGNENTTARWTGAGHILIDLGALYDLETFEILFGLNTDPPGRTVTAYKSDASGTEIEYMGAIASAFNAPVNTPTTNSANVRYVKFVCNDGDVECREIRLLSEPAPASGTYRAYFPVAEGNVTQGVVSGDGYSVQTVQQGGTSALSASVSTIQSGSDGSDAEISQGPYLEPDHLRVYLATDTDDLADINMADDEDEHILTTCTGSTFAAADLWNPFYPLDRGRNPDDMVAGAQAVTASLTFPNDTDDVAELLHASEDECTAGAFWVRMAWKCGPNEFWIDLYCTRNDASGFSADNNVYLNNFPLARTFNASGSVVFTHIEAV